MSTTRSRTGCLVCRIRKKKCDEERPACRSCTTRSLKCLGYNEPVPKWFYDKTTWEDVRDCPEARALRALAETRYKINRKTGWRDTQDRDSVPVGSDTTNNDLDCLGPRGGIVRFGTSQTQLRIPASTYPVVNTPNTWQLLPRTVWWEGKMNSLESQPISHTSRDTRLTMLFVDVIHPLTHTFYCIESSKDRSWMLDYIIGDRALHYAALSVSACFEHSLSQGPSINDIGICPKVRELQSRAVSDLRPRIQDFSANTKDMPAKDIVCMGMRLIDVVFQLLNLELFSMLQGSWEMHYCAARLLAHNVDTRGSFDASGENDGQVGMIETTFLSLPPQSERARTLEFCLLNFVWIDTIATATFGLSAYSPIAFDYQSLLRSGKLKPETTMGCCGWILATIHDIVLLQHDIRVQNTSNAELDMPNLRLRQKSIADTLKSGIERLEEPLTPPNNRLSPDDMNDIRLISIIWVHATELFLHLVFPNRSATVEAQLIAICLVELENLPTRLVMRVHWPYTIAGCMAKSIEQQDRFRQIFGKVMEQSFPPGLTWKGLMVMEECWRLRQIRGDIHLDWRDAMDGLGARVLLL